MRRYKLRNDQRERIEGLVPGREGTVGVTAANNCLFVEAIIYRYRAGIPWRDMPERFGDWKNVHRRFRRWAKSGVWERIFQYLAADADNEYAMIGSTFVRAHQHSTGAKKKDGSDQAIGRSRGGLSTKIHALVDALGNPLRFFLSGGEAHDLAGAGPLLPDMQADLLTADKGFDADERVLEPFAAAGKAAVIPPRRHRSSQRQFDRHLYKERRLIENFVGKIKQFRAIATRYDETARNFLVAVHLVAATIWLNRRHALIKVEEFDLCQVAARRDPPVSRDQQAPGALAVAGKLMRFPTRDRP